MKRAALASLCLGLAACMAAPPTDTAKSRLVGGDQDTHTDDPALWLETAECTGVAVMPNVILTAAHCVMGDDSKLKADFAGTGGYLSVTNDVVLDGTEQYANLKILTTVVHQTWLNQCQSTGCSRLSHDGFKAPYPYDIAAIVLSDPLPSSFPLAQASIAPLNVGDTVTIAGYGCEDGLTGPKPSPYRRKIGTSSVLDSSDVNATGPYVADTGAYGQHYIVTAGKHHDASTPSLCPGDSGGPLFQGYPGSWNLVGINSDYTFNPGEDISYDNTFTRVVDPDLVAWLQQLMFGNPNAAPQAPQHVRTLSLAQFGVSLSWDAALAGTQKITVARRNSGSAPVELSPTTMSYVDPGPWGVDGQTYTYDVCFANTLGSACSTATVTFSKAPPVAPPPPLDAKDMKVAFDTARSLAHVSWTVEPGPGQGFVVQARAWAPSVAADWTSTALLPPTAATADLFAADGVSYDVRVCAVYDANNRWCSPAPHFDMPPAPKGWINLVIDPSFEGQKNASAVSGAWYSNPRAEARPEPGIATAHIGTTDVSLFSTVGVTQLDQRVHVTPGQRYVMSLWLKGNVDAFFGATDSQTVLLAQAHVMPSPSSWTRYSLPVTIGKDGIAIVFMAPSALESVASPQLVVDDVSLVPADDCAPLSCSQAHACGALPDGCGGTVQCGGCGAGTSCGGGGFANTCGTCTPQRVCSPDDCGAIPDGCGGTLHCKKCQPEPPPCPPGVKNCKPI